MSFWTDVEHFFKTTESDVLAVIAKIKAEVPVIEADINNALRWVANAAPSIAASVTEVATLVEQVGIMNPTVVKAIADANKAVVAINAFANAMQKGQGTAASVVAGYVAVKSAQSSAATAAVAAASASKPGPVATAAVAAAA